MGCDLMGCVVAAFYWNWGTHMAVKNKKQPEQVISLDSTSQDSTIMDDEEVNEMPVSVDNKRITPRNHRRENAFDFTKQLDATQLYLNEIGFSPC